MADESNRCRNLLVKLTTCNFESFVRISYNSIANHAKMVVLFGQVGDICLPAIAKKDDL